MEPNNTPHIKGQISGVNLSAFLQMIEMEQKTCTIKVFVKKDLGRIFFLNGRLIDAATIHQKKLAAMYEIISWDHTVIEVDENQSRTEDKINLPLMHILMEGARYRDEIRRKNSTDSPDSSEAASEKAFPLKVMNDQNFCLEIGVNLLLDFEQLDLTLQSTLVGIAHGKYLILKMPGPFTTLDHEQLKQDTLTIKSLYKGTIYAFRSKILGVISQPTELLFIEYPARIEHHELRSHKRYKCSIVAQAYLDETQSESVIENISKGGCLCHIEAFLLKDKPANSLLDDIITFRCHFPGSNGEVSFVGKIRNARKQLSEIAVGIEFFYPDNNRDIERIIHDYIRIIECSGVNV